MLSAVTINWDFDCSIITLGIRRTKLRNNLYEFALCLGIISFHYAKKIGLRKSKPVIVRLYVMKKGRKFQS